jgi:hypothetical protein
MAVPRHRGLGSRLCSRLRRDTEPIAHTRTEDDGSYEIPYDLGNLAVVGRGLVELVVKVIDEELNDVKAENHVLVSPGAGANIDVDLGRPGRTQWESSSNSNYGPDTAQITRSVSCRPATTPQCNRAASGATEAGRRGPASGSRSGPRSCSFRGRPISV